MISLQRRSASAAAGAIGAYLFNGSLYESRMHSREGHVPPQLVKKVPLAFFAKLLSELQNLILYHYFAILPLRRVIERERTP